MFVEDFITELARKTVLFKEWDENFVKSVTLQIERSRGLSSKQAKTFQTIVERYKPALLADGFSSNAIEEILSFPRYRNIPYQSTNVPNEVRYLGDNKLGFRFKPTPELREMIKDTRRPRDSKIMPVFNRQMKIWIVPVTTENLPYIMKLVPHFQFGDDVAEFLTLCENSKTENSTFFINGDEIIANISANNYLDSWVRNVIYGEIL